MLLLQILLLAVLLPGSDNEDGFQEQTSFKAIHTLSFYNHSSTQSWSSGRLDDLQIHRWESKSGRIIFLQPWSKGNLSNKEITELEEFLRAFYNAVPRFRSLAIQWKFEYPIEIQVAMGCELHPGGATVGFTQFACQGSELVHFQNNSWLPSLKNETKAQQACRAFNQRHVTNNIIHRLISDTCPRFLFSVHDTGKADLQKKVKPKAWLSTGPNSRSDRQMLVCHVSGFHPKPIWVKWMRGEQVQHGTQQSDILPNADGTWYLRISLDVEATETSGLSCRVKHSSLEGQDIILHLEHHHTSLGLIILAVMVPLVLLTGLAFCLKKHWSHCEPPPPRLPLE